ncbi:MAG: ImmA/IrrE family metallo-endopeptidase [Acidobacteria bacterium]|nr:ImmA/IrrE family metallo-endopeptidase [Acidobacteriota bacterium]
MGVRRKYIRDLAEQLIDEYRQRKPPIRVKHIAELLGIEVKLELVDDELSGFLYRDRKSGRTVIGANGNHHANRINFTIAHELGHFLLHEAESVHLDERKPGYTLQLRNANSSTGEDSNEREANLFAAELLMPARYLEKDLKEKNVDLIADDDFLRNLALKYGVSVQALTIRLDYLGYVNH